MNEEWSRHHLDQIPVLTIGLLPSGCHKGQSKLFEPEARFIQAAAEISLLSAFVKFNFLTSSAENYYWITGLSRSRQSTEVVTKSEELDKFSITQLQADEHRSSLQLRLFIVSKLALMLLRVLQFLSLSCVLSAMCFVTTLPLLVGFYVQ